MECESSEDVDSSWVVSMSSFNFVFLFCVSTERSMSKEDDVLFILDGSFEIDEIS